MGNSLSQCLAEIVTSCTIHETLKRIEENKISFVVKFVDDLGSAMDSNMVKDLRIDREDEDEGQSVSYSNCKLIRRKDNTIGFVWWQKPYSSKQILNFHSNHPLIMKRNVVCEYIKNALTITTDDYIFKAVAGLNSVLKRSSYPENFFKNYVLETLKNLQQLQVSSILGCTNKEFNFENELLSRWIKTIPEENVKIMKCKVNKYNNKGQRSSQLKWFITIPFNNKLFDRANKIVKKYKLNVKLAPKSIMNNGRFVVSNVKDKRKISNMKNCLFAAKCINLLFGLKLRI